VCNNNLFSTAVAVRVPPAIAGGEIRFFNRVLQAQVEVVRLRDAGLAAAHLIIVIDPALLRKRHSQIKVLNEKGDVVYFSGPEYQPFQSQECERLQRSLAETIPGWGSFANAHPFFIPTPNTNLLEHSREFWKALTAASSGRVYLSNELESKPSPPLAEVGLDANPTWPECRFIHGQPTTWFSVKHLEKLNSLDLSPANALLPEKKLKKRISKNKPSALRSQFVQFKTELKSQLSELQPFAEVENARLLGAWSRLRRDLNQSVNRFEQSAERAIRNNHGIQDSGLHAICQAMQPHNLSQEQGLSLLCAAAQFSLPLNKATELFPSNYDDFRAENLLLSTNGDYLGRI
jgi:hypothetical protein